MPAKYKVADVLELEHAHLDGLCTNGWQLRTLHAIRKCRTKALGGHIAKCDKCQKAHLFYHSCRNRHCPTCQGHKVAGWVHAREQELLPVSYFHVVFTLPAALNPVALNAPVKVYAILFKAAWQTLKQFGANPKHLGAKMGMIGVLHTWGQNLSLHPHLHCIVPGGGVSKGGNWKNARGKGKFLFNVKSMGSVFRAKFVAELRKALPGLPQSLYDALFKSKWVVYAKRPFKNTQSVIAYLGRYTHKIAISNYRIKNIDYKNRTVTFSLKDYRKGGKKTTQTLSAGEFIRRFALHVLPKGFRRIRHYGILSSSWKKEKLPALQGKLTGPTSEGGANEPVPAEMPETMLNRCPTCKVGTLETILVFDKRGPPEKYQYLISKPLNNP
jgi:putative transposase/transposase-like zinc-binding protein